jgi:hypothetical protein
VEKAKSELKTKVDELYNLDCEDVVCALPLSVPLSVLCPLSLFPSASLSVLLLLPLCALYSLDYEDVVCAFLHTSFTLVTPLLYPFCIPIRGCPGRFVSVYVTNIHRSEVIPRFALSISRHPRYAPSPALPLCVFPLLSPSPALLPSIPVRSPCTPCNPTDLAYSLAGFWYVYRGHPEHRR